MYVSKPVGASPKSQSNAVSKSMKSNKSSGTKPELILSKLLQKRPARTTLPGRPDFAYRNDRLAVFVHGCFWHRCPTCNLPLPKTNSAFWNRKFARNVERDALNKEELESMDWRVLVIWEHELKENPSDCALRVKEALKTADIPALSDADTPRSFPTAETSPITTRFQRI